MLQVWTSRCSGECVKEAGGAWRSSRMRLCVAFRVERRVAVARPMPEEPPVMRIVLGVDVRDVRAEMEGWKRAMVVVVIGRRRFPM